MLLLHDVDKTRSSGITDTESSLKDRYARITRIDYGINCLIEKIILIGSSLITASTAGNS